MNDSDDLAAQVKAWRGKVSAREAAAAIGVPWRTLEYVEQHNSFRYPELLRIAIKAVKLEGKK